MNTFLKNILLFCIPLIIAFVSLEILVRDANSLYKEKWENYTTKADSINILILGNSHALNGIDPSEFDLFAYNMAFGAQSLYFDEAITLKQIDKMSNLKFVLISIDYHSLFNMHSEARDIFYHYYYDITYKNKSYLLEDLSWVYGLGFKQSIREHIFRKKSNSKNGFTSFNTTNWSELNPKKANERVNQLENGFSKENLKYNKTALDNFINILKTKNVTPILITLPCHHYFNTALDKDILIQNDATIKYICNKYQIQHFDFLKLKYPDSHFYNLDHLNIKGAKKISKKINSLIEEISL